MVTSMVCTCRRENQAGSCYCSLSGMRIQARFVEKNILCNVSSGSLLRRHMNRYVIYYHKLAKTGYTEGID